MHCTEKAACACVGSRARKRELITISDDSDEEPVTLVPGSPVLVPDDDDVSIVEVTHKQCSYRDLYFISLDKWKHVLLFCLPK